MADLIAEGQGEPAVLRELYERLIAPRRASTVADVERGKSAGEFAIGIDPELLLDANSARSTIGSSCGTPR